MKCIIFANDIKIKLIKLYKYHSLNGKAKNASFKNACLHAQASDGGLYFPNHITSINEGIVKRINHSTIEDIAWHVLSPFMGSSMPSRVLQDIIVDSFSFPIPLVEINDRVSILELFHGPTQSFKDVGARFMSRCIRYFAKEIDKKIVVLVATSGDTGGAVVNAFKDIPNIEVVVLYPENGITAMQEMQIAYHGGNIKSIAVKGSFDDCQAMVKQAFNNKDISDKLFLTSANSINVARWIAQQYYYLLLWKMWPAKQNPPIIVVPSGNMGNVSAGVLSMKMGFPFNHFVVAVNANKTFPGFLSTGKITIGSVEQTISNAMDIANPSNLIRLQALFDFDMEEMRKHISSYSISDEQTVSTIKKIYQDYSYLLDPHTAVGYAALETHLENDTNDSHRCVLLSTAHPIKFTNVLSPIVGQQVLDKYVSLCPVPTNNKMSISMEHDFLSLQSFLLSLL